MRRKANLEYINTLDNKQKWAQSFPFFQISFKKKLGKKHFSTQVKKETSTRDT